MIKLGTPIRIQRRRTKGWKLPPNTVIVDRTTDFGNVFRKGTRFRASVDAPWCVIFSDQQAVDMFRSFCDHDIGAHFRTRIRNELRGKNLACWCPLDQPCHADILLEIANA